MLKGKQNKGNLTSEVFVAISDTCGDDLITGKTKHKPFLFSVKIGKIKTHSKPCTLYNIHIIRSLYGII